MVEALPSIELSVVDAIERRRHRIWKGRLTNSLRHWQYHCRMGDSMERLVIVRPLSLAVSQGIVQLRGHEIVSRSLVLQDVLELSGEVRTILSSKGNVRQGVRSKAV